MAAAPGEDASDAAMKSRHQNSLDRDRSRKEIDDLKRQIIDGLPPTTPPTNASSPTIPTTLAEAAVTQQLQSSKPPKKAKSDVSSRTMTAASASDVAERERSQGLVRRAMQRANDLIDHLRYTSMQFVGKVDETGRWMKTLRDEVDGASLEQWVTVSRRRNHRDQSTIRWDAQSNLTKYEELHLFEKDAEATAIRDLLVDERDPEEMLRELCASLGLENVNGKWIRPCDCEPKLERVKIQAREQERRVTKAKYLNSFINQLDGMITFIDANMEQIREHEEHRVAEIIDLRHQNYALTQALERQKQAVTKLKADLKKSGVKMVDDSLEQAEREAAHAAAAAAASAAAKRKKESEQRQRGGGRRRSSAIPVPGAVSRNVYEHALERLAAVERQSLFGLDFDAKEAVATVTTTGTASMISPSVGVQTMTEQEWRAQMQAPGGSRAVTLVAKKRNAGAASAAPFVQELTVAGQPVLPIPSFQDAPVTYAAETRNLGLQIEKLGQTYMEGLTQLETTRSHTLSQIAECINTFKNTAVGGHPDATATAATDLHDQLVSLFGGSTSAARLALKQVGAESKSIFSMITRSCHHVSDRINRLAAGENGEQTADDRAGANMDAAISPQKPKRESFAEYVANIGGTDAANTAAATGAPKGELAKGSKKRGTIVEAPAIPVGAKPAASGGKSGAGGKAESKATKGGSSRANSVAFLEKSQAAASVVDHSPMAPNATTGGGASVAASPAGASDVKAIAEQLARSAQDTLDGSDAAAVDRAQELAAKLVMETGRANDVTRQLFALRDTVVVVIKAMVDAQVPIVDNGSAVDMQVAKTPKEVLDTIVNWKTNVCDAALALSTKETMCSPSVARNARILHAELASFFMTASQVGLGTASIGPAPGDDPSKPGAFPNFSKIPESSVNRAMESMVSAITSMKNNLKVNAVSMKRAERRSVEEIIIQLAEMSKSVAAAFMAMVEEASATLRRAESADAEDLSTEVMANTSVEAVLNGIDPEDVELMARVSLKSSNEQSDLVRVEGDALAQVADTVVCGLKRLRVLLPMFATTFGGKISSVVARNQAKETASSTSLQINQLMREIDVLKAEVVKARRVSVRMTSLRGIDVTLAESVGSTNNGGESIEKVISEIEDPRAAFNELERLFAQRVEAAKRDLAMKVAAIKSESHAVTTRTSQLMMYQFQDVEDDQREALSQLCCNTLESLVRCFFSALLPTETTVLYANSLIEPSAAIDSAEGTAQQPSTDETGSVPPQPPAEHPDDEWVGDGSIEPLVAMANRMFNRLHKPFLQNQKFFKDGDAQTETKIVLDSSTNTAAPAKRLDVRSQTEPPAVRAVGVTCDLKPTPVARAPKAAAQESSTASTPKQQQQQQQQLPRSNNNLRAGGGSTRLEASSNDAAAASVSMNSASQLMDHAAQSSLPLPMMHPSSHPASMAASMTDAPQDLTHRPQPSVSAASTSKFHQSTHSSPSGDVSATATPKQRQYASSSRADELQTDEDGDDRDDDGTAANASSVVSAKTPRSAVDEALGDPEGQPASSPVDSSNDNDHSLNASQSQLKKQLPSKASGKQKSSTTQAVSSPMRRSRVTLGEAAEASQLEGSKRADESAVRGDTSESRQSSFRKTDDASVQCELLKLDEVASGEHFVRAAADSGKFPPPCAACDARRRRKMTSTAAQTVSVVVASRDPAMKVTPQMHAYRSVDGRGAVAEAPVVASANPTAPLVPWQPVEDYTGHHTLPPLATASEADRHRSPAVTPRGRGAVAIDTASAHTLGDPETELLRGRSESPMPSQDVVRLVRRSPDAVLAQASADRQLPSTASDPIGPSVALAALSRQFQLLCRKFSDAVKSACRGVASLAVDDVSMHSLLRVVRLSDGMVPWADPDALMMSTAQADELVERASHVVSSIVVSFQCLKMANGPNVVRRAAAATNAMQFIDPSATAGVAAAGRSATVSEHGVSQKDAKRQDDTDDISPPHAAEGERQKSSSSLLDSYIPPLLPMRLHSVLIGTLTELIRRVKFEQRVVIDDPYAHVNGDVNPFEVMVHDITLLSALHRLLTHDSVISKRKVANALKQLVVRRRLEAMAATRVEVRAEDNPAARSLLDRQERKLRDTMAQLQQLQKQLKQERRKNFDSIWSFDRVHSSGLDDPGSTTRVAHAMLPAMQLRRQRLFAERGLIRLKTPDVSDMAPTSMDAEAGQHHTAPKERSPRAVPTTAAGGVVSPSSALQTTFMLGLPPATIPLTGAADAVAPLAADVHFSPSTAKFGNGSGVARKMSMQQHVSRRRGTLAAIVPPAAGGKKLVGNQAERGDGIVVVDPNEGALATASMTPPPGPLGRPLSDGLFVDNTAASRLPLAVMTSPTKPTLPSLSRVHVAMHRGSLMAPPMKYVVNPTTAHKLNVEPDADFFAHPLAGKQAAISVRTVATPPKRRGVVGNDAAAASTT